jgi:two-component system sensor histidine kinase BaeS
MNDPKAIEFTRKVRRKLIIYAVIFLTLSLFLTLTINLLLTANQLRGEASVNPFMDAPLASTLEAYYLGHGSWSGVEEIFSGNTSFSGARMQHLWHLNVLVDKEGIIILDNGQKPTKGAETVYTPVDPKNYIELKAFDQTIGRLYFQPDPNPGGRSVLERLVPFVIIRSAIPVLILVIIGLLLLNRWIKPLAELTGATKAIAEGKLNTRISSIKRDDDLRALSESFNQMAASLEQDEDMRHNFFADITHELRTPLTILRARLEGIIDGIYPPSQEVITLALDQTYLLEKLVSDLRLLALAEAHALTIEPKVIDLNPVINKALDLFSAQASELGISLESSFQTKTNLAFADSARVEQIIDNLLSNALKFSPKNTTITTSAATLSDFAEVHVLDQGPGVPLEEIGRIFDRFWRKDKSRSRSSGGSGLGLAICKELVELQGGKIKASNREEGGLDICFTLPKMPSSKA